MEYAVKVTRVAYGVVTIIIEADSQEQANWLALEEAPNYRFPEHDAEYLLAESLGRVFAGSGREVQYERPSV